MKIIFVRREIKRRRITSHMRHPLFRTILSKMCESEILIGEGGEMKRNRHFCSPLFIMALEIIRLSGIKPGLNRLQNGIEILYTSINRWRKVKPKEMLGKQGSESVRTVVRDERGFNFALPCCAKPTRSRFRKSSLVSSSRSACFSLSSKFFHIFFCFFRRKFIQMHLCF